jgi:transcriptional regulator with XRE-family HTH domain
METERPTSESLAEWLKRQLARKEWSQADFARHLNTTNGVVSRWLRGERIPSPEYCDRIADVLDFDRDVVLALAGHRPLAEAIDPESPKARIMALADRVEWTEDRAAGVEALFRSFLDNDRRKVRS